MTDGLFRLVWRKLATDKKKKVSRWGITGGKVVARVVAKSEFRKYEIGIVGLYGS